MLVKDIQKKYPLHYHVWNNNHEELEKILKEDENKEV